jgi:uncharacterized protein (UPF0261 family)
MPITIAIVGCLDTKGEELLFVQRAIEAQGVRVHVIDTGVLGAEDSDITSAGAPAPPRSDAPAPDTPASVVASRGGSSLAELRRRGDRGEAIAAMSLGAAEIVRELAERGEIHGIIGAGGSANTTIASTAMRALPVGFPKMLVSTLASGDVSPFVGTKDIAMMYSVVDVAGINRISARVLSNAARAVVAMARGGLESVATQERGIIAATMFGVTTPCVTAARKILEAAGYEVLVFHATGSGGRAMEGLIDDGFIDGVLDITTTELADELVGGILSAGPTRLTAASRHGIPQVVSIGAVDMVNFGPRDTVPARFAGRLFYQHNANVTLMRTTPDENAEIGRRIATRVGSTLGVARVILPLRGVSAIDAPDKPFHDPEASRRCREALREGLPPSVRVEELDAHINDTEFAERAAKCLLELLTKTKRPR